MSDDTLLYLADHARLRISDGTVRCERVATDDLLAVDGSVVLVGAPGCGKSGMLYELACQLDGENVVVLGVDRLAGDAGATRTTLGLQHDLVDVLRQWSGAGRATLVLDGLDAARGESTTWLSRLVRELRDTRWRVVASMRRFDLQHSMQWQEAFRGRPVAPGGPAEATDLPEVRHYLLGDLTADEVGMLARSSVEINRLLAGASPHLIDLVRNPFNMRLATELLELGEPVESLATARDQLQLLQRYWERRVTDGLRQRTRLRALGELVEAMLAARRLSADDTVVPDALCDDLDTLLHDGVLQEVPASLRAQSARTLVFSHHILFDFAAAVVALSATAGSRLGPRLRDDPDLAVVARPSIDMHLADLWHYDGKHARFAAVVDDLVADDQVLAGIAAARVAIENVVCDGDLSWLVERFASDVAAAAIVTSWIGGVMEADPDLVLKDTERLIAWATLAHEVTTFVNQQYTAQAVWAALQLLVQLDRIRPLAPGTADAPIRAAGVARLMAVCLGGCDERGGLAVRVARLLPRAVAVDALHAKTVLAVVDDASLIAHRTEMLRLFVQEVEHIAHAAPDTAGALLVAAWRHDDDSEEITHMSTGVLSLTSTRRQDLDHLRWLTGDRFPAYVAAVGLTRAATTVGAVMEACGEEWTRRSNEIRALGAEGRLLDFASDLECGPGHGAAGTIVDAFIGALDSTEEDAEPVVAAAVASISHPEFWSRLLTAARQRPKWQLPVAAVLESGALAANTETRLAVGELMRVLSPTLGPEDHRRLLEEPIHRAAALFAPDHAGWREESIDQIVGYLDVTRVQDTPLRDRLVGLLAGQGPPAAPEPPRVVGGWSSLSLAEVIGDDTYAALGDDARGALDDLRNVLDMARGGEGTPAELETAFRCAVAAARAVDAASVRDLITRAVDRLALHPAVLPSTELGEIVVSMALDACDRKGDAR